MNHNIYMCILRLENGSKFRHSYIEEHISSVYVFNRAEVLCHTSYFASFLFRILNKSLNTKEVISISNFILLIVPVR